MDELTEFVSAVWIVLNYPIIKIGNSSITFWAIILNLILIMAFIAITSRLKDWLLSSVM